MSDGFRVEHDSMGEVRVPAGAHWGAQTQRAVENFPISGRPVPPDVVHALAAIKAEAARVNVELAGLDRAKADAIGAAADAVARGDHDDQFPIDVFQTGSGTSTNMNVNEVVAHLAAEAGQEGVHPNDHVNLSQSSNDTFPSAIAIAAVAKVHRRGEDVARGLPHVHVVVGVDVLAGECGDHLVGVHVRARPRARLEHVDRELVVELARRDAISGGGDALGTVAVEKVEIRVGARCGGLDPAEPTCDRRRDRLAGDWEVPDRLLRLHSPELPLFDSFGHSRRV